MYKYEREPNECLFFFVAVISGLMKIYHLPRKLMEQNKGTKK